jgi:hypothetical protein
MVSSDIFFLKCTRRPITFTPCCRDARGYCVYLRWLVPSSSASSNQAVSLKRVGFVPRSSNSLSKIDTNQPHVASRPKESTTCLKYARWSRWETVAGRFRCYIRWLHVQGDVYTTSPRPLQHWFIILTSLRGFYQNKKSSFYDICLPPNRSLTHWWLCALKTGTTPAMIWSGTRAYLLLRSGQIHVLYSHLWRAEIHL